MPQIPELANGILFFVPGLLLVQTLYLGGILRGLSGFERAVWGLIASVPIRWAVPLIGPSNLGVDPGLELEMSLLGLVLLLGVIASLLRQAFAFGEEEEEQE
jgi:hypothetical protein